MIENKNDESSQNLSHSMVHYLLAIHKLKESRGYARVTDIATSLKLSKGSVSTAIANLKKRQLVLEDEGSKFLSLTESGHVKVHKILSSRTLLYYFLKDFLGTSEEAALNDSCLMEHLLSGETREKFFEFMKKMACSCGRSQERSQEGFIPISTTLDICRFKNSKEFESFQIGDSFLTSSHGLN